MILSFLAIIAHSFSFDMFYLDALKNNKNMFRLTIVLLGSSRFLSAPVLQSFQTQWLQNSYNWLAIIAQTKWNIAILVSVLLFFIEHAHLIETSCKYISIVFPDFYRYLIKTIYLNLLASLQNISHKLYNYKTTHAGSIRSTVTKMVYHHRSISLLISN